jgi:hypothetical protein
MTKQWLRDTIERVASTFVEAFIGVMLLTLPENWLDVSALRAAAVSALIAALAVVKAAIASRTANTVSPASLAPSTSVN